MTAKHVSLNTDCEKGAYDSKSPIKMPPGFEKSETKKDGSFKGAAAKEPYMPGKGM